MAHRPVAIRNLAIVGSSSSGKTALIDALAFITKDSTRHGNSLEGTSVSDTLPEEKERKQTLNSHMFGFHWEDALLNVIDTPGHADCLADALTSLHIAEAALLCVSASGRLTFHGRRLFDAAKAAGIGRAVVVTHPDGENAHFEEVLMSLQEVFGDTVVPVTYPDADGFGFKAVHDVLHGDGPRAKEYRSLLEERVAEADDEILAQYLETGELSDADFQKYLPIAIAKEKVTPLFTVCPPKEVGLRKLCSFVRTYFPSPASFGPRVGSNTAEGPFDQIIEPDEAGPFAARVFKTIVDPYVGRVSWLRCYRGSMTAEAGFLNVRTGKHEKLSGLQVREGVETKPVDRVVAGDIFLISKLETLAFGDTVTADAAPLVLKPVEFPAPTFSLAVNPASRGDEQKIVQGLDKLASEDPTFRVQRDPNTGELVVSGTSPLHIDVQLKRLEKRYHCGTVTHPPLVAYKETVTAPAEGHHRHKKQSGGRGQFGEAYLRIRPRDRGLGYQFVDKVVGGSIPRNFIPEVEKGVRHFLDKGGLAGCRVEDVEVEVYDGKYHDVDSDQISFQIAGERAFAEAFAKARPILLEPIMDVVIRVPERFTGDVASNLATLRGRMSGMEMAGGIQTIQAQVPLKEMQDYTTQLRSITAGEGSFEMRPSHYEPVPPNVQHDIVAAYKARLEQAHVHH
ncbi:MAG: elongation factor G [Planctomycetes bacterium]|nr:elongation factor G [Planctomycetota bacterium]